MAGAAFITELVEKSLRKGPSIVIPNEVRDLLFSGIREKRDSFVASRTTRQHRRRCISKSLERVLEKRDPAAASPGTKVILKLLPL